MGSTVAADNEPVIALVVGIAENRVIGRGGDLPWRLPSDMKRFRRITMGKPLIMGRKTFASLPKALDGRDNIVVTRNAAFAAEGAIVARDLDEALRIARECAKARGADEIVVIGGAEIFRAALPLADRIYLTRVHALLEGDVFFPRMSILAAGGRYRASRASVRRRTTTTSPFWCWSAPPHNAHKTHAKSVRRILLSGEFRRCFDCYSHLFSCFPAAACRAGRCRLHAAPH